MNGKKRKDWVAGFCYDPHGFFFKPVTVLKNARNDFDFLMTSDLTLPGENIRPDLLARNDFGLMMT